MNLFGGALQIQVPNEHQFLDAGSFREIPDNQEVFVHKESDESIIIELLEYDPSMNLASHAEQLAHENSCSEWKIVEERTNCVHCTQNASKFNQADRHLVHIYLGLLRLAEYKTDVLLSWNAPIVSSIDLADFEAVLDSLQLVDASVFIQ